MNEIHKWLLKKPGLCLIFTIKIRVAANPPSGDLLRSVQRTDLESGHDGIS